MVRIMKANQMSKVCASSHEYPHVEKIKNLCEKNFNCEANDKQLDSEDTQQSSLPGYLHAACKLQSAMQAINKAASVINI